MPTDGRSPEVLTPQSRLEKARAHLRDAQKLSSKQHSPLVAEKPIEVALEKVREQTVGQEKQQKVEAADPDVKVIPEYPAIGESLPGAEKVLQSLEAARAAGVRIPEALDQAVAEAGKDQRVIDRNKEPVGVFGGDDGGWDWIGGDGAGGDEGRTGGPPGPDDRDRDAHMPGSVRGRDAHPVTPGGDHGRSSRDDEVVTRGITIGELRTLDTPQQIEFLRDLAPNAQEDIARELGLRRNVRRVGLIRRRDEVSFEPIEGAGGGHGHENGHDDGEWPKGIEPGIRRMERAPRRDPEAEPLPEIKDALEQLCSTYKEWFEEGRMTPALIGEFNKKFGWIIEYVEAKREDDRLLNLEDELARFLRGNIDQLRQRNEITAGDRLDDEGRRAAQERFDIFSREFQAADLGRKLELIELRAMSPENVAERERLMQQLQRLKTDALRDDEVRARYNELRERDGFQEGDILREADYLADAVGSGSRAGGEILNTRSAITGHIASRFEGVRDRVETERGKILEEIVLGERVEGAEDEIERIDLPAKSFEQVMRDWNDTSLTPEQIEEAGRGVEAYMKMARKIGLVARSNKALDTEFAEIEERLQRGELAERIVEEREGAGVITDDMGKFAEKGRREMESFILGVLEGEQRIEINPGEFRNIGDFNGVVAFNLWQGNRSIHEFLENAGFSQSGLRADANYGISEGVWNWRETQASGLNRREEERRKRLWEIQWSNSYTLERCQSVEDLIIASNQHLKWIQNTERTPEAALQKIQFFSEAITARGVALGSEAESNHVRLMYQAESYVYLSEQFNRAYNVGNLAAVYARMNNEFEGMDHWAAVAQLRNGLVYRAYMVQQSPEYELMFRMMGPHGQMDRHTNGQLLINRMMRQRLAESLVGEMISDTFVERAGGGGMLIVGDRALVNGRWEKVSADARSRNLSSLGFDRSQAETESAYVGKTEDLLEKIHGLGDEKSAKEVLTPAEWSALRLRDIAARIKGKDALIGFNRGKKITKEERADYKRALEEATEAVNIFMQMNSMTGDKTVRGGPSYMARPEGVQGVEATRSRDVVGADKVPVWMAENFVHYAMNMARIKWGERSRNIKHSHDGHEANLFQDYLNHVRDAAIKEIYEKGWDARLPQYDLHEERNPVTAYTDEGYAVKSEEVHYGFEAHGNYKYKHKVKGVEREDDVGLLYTANHVLGRYLDSTYVANQKEIHTQISSDAIREQARQLRDGVKREDEVNVLAVLRLIIDPTLNRIIQVPKSQQKHEEAYILAAAHGTYMDHWEIRRGLSIQFDDLTEYEIPNFDGGTKRVFYPQALAAANPDRWSPRARYMVARDIIPETSLGGKLGMRHSLEALKLMKRTNLKEQQIDQEVIDNPLLASAPQGYKLGFAMLGMLFGADGERGHEPGIHEKPTRSAEEIRSQLNLIANREGSQTFKIIMSHGKEVWEWHNYDQQKQFLKQVQQILAPAKDICEFFRKFSDNSTATGARDLRYVDLFDWSKTPEDGKAFYKVDFDKGSTSGIGLGRHLTSLWAKDFLYYMSHYRMKGADGTWRYNGAMSEYPSEAGWWKLLNSVVRVSELDAEDREILTETLGKLPEHMTVIDFLIGKWSRR